MASVQFTPEAFEDSLQIWKYVAQFSNERADELGLLQSKCLLLAQDSRLGWVRMDVHMGVHSFPLGNYMIYYRSKSEDIEV